MASLTTTPTNNNFEIPPHLLKKAAESALVSSFVDLNTKKISPLKPNNSPCCHKVVIDLVAKSPGGSYDTSVFIKVIPKTSNESKVYEEFIRQILNPSPSPPFLPKCYLTHATPENVMIFLENLKITGFQSPPVAPLEFNHALLAIECLSRFHASSYFLQRQLGLKAKGRLALLAKFPFLKQTPSQNKGAEMVGNIFEKIILKIIDADNPSLAFKIQRKIEPSQIYQKIGQILENEKYENDDFYVVCHGDFKTDNLLFKYREKEPEECRMVDLKRVRLAPIASDLTYFLLTSTTFEMRQEFEEKLLALYCDTFEEHLLGKYRRIGQKEDFDVELFHRRLEEQYKRMLEFGFYSGVVVTLTAIFGGLTTEALMNLDVGGANFDKLVKDCLSNEDFKKRVMGAVKQLVKNKIF